MSKDLIVKSNALVEASYQLTANEQRLILSVIAQIPKQEPVRDDRLYIVSVDNFVELGVHPKTAYRELEESMQRLFDRMVVIRINEKYLKTRWVQSIGKVDKEMIKNMNLLSNYKLEQISENSCIYGIQFSNQILPFLTNLSDNFTKYKLIEIAGFSSSYSYRIYEFLMQYTSTGYVKISLDELRSRLQLEGKYKATKDLRMWVLEIAIKEINEKSPYKIEYKLTKTGKKFTHLELKFKQKQGKIPKNTKNNKPKPLTKAQASYFGSLLANDSSFGSSFAHTGESLKEFESRIKKELTQAEFVKKYWEYLLKYEYQVGVDGSGKK